MKIKEVERAVGMTRANIRFYENEGLIHPARDKENQYREYSMEDVQMLHRIKTLRAIGISIPDIKELDKGNMTLDQAVKKRMQTIEEEKKNLELVGNVCIRILKSELSYEDVGEKLLDTDVEKEKRFWRGRLNAILKEDITKELVNRRQLNTILGLLLAYGYFLNVIAAVLLGDRLLDYYGGAMDESIIKWTVSCFAIIFICKICGYMTASIPVHVVLFHLLAVVLTPVTAGAFYAVRAIGEQMFGPSGESVNILFSGKVLAAFWCLMIVSILVRSAASVIWEQAFLKLRYTLLFAVLSGCAVGLAANLAIHQWKAGLASGLIFSLYLGLSWFYAVRGDQKRSRYYVIVTAERIINIAGAALDQKGRNTEGIVFK